MSFSLGFKAYAVVPKVSLMIGEEGKVAELAVIEEAISAVSFGHHLDAGPAFSCSYLYQVIAYSSNSLRLCFCEVFRGF